MLCVFDVNETLLDLAALDEFFAEVTGDPDSRREWFDLMIFNAVTVTAAGGYLTFGEIAMACLPPVAARRGRDVTPEQQRELGGLMRRLPPHPDARDTLARLRAAGLGVVTLTNSTREVAEDQLTNAGLRDLLDGVYSVDDVRRLKPAPEPYLHAVAQQRVAPADAVLVAAHAWDVAGAAAAGLGTAFVARGGATPMPTAPAPTYTAGSLGEVADLLLERPAG